MSVVKYFDRILIHHRTVDLLCHIVHKSHGVSSLALIVAQHECGLDKASSTATTPKESSRKIQFNHQGNTPPGAITLAPRGRRMSARSAHVRMMATMATMAQSAVREGAKCARTPARVRGKGRTFAERAAVESHSSLLYGPNG